MTSAKKPPETIRLSSLDLCFLIPETEDVAGVYFPMSLVGCIPLKRPLQLEEFVAALRQVNQRFPQFRLGYKLDYVRNRWVRVPDDQLESYLASCVEKRSSSLDVAQKLSEAISTNITPFYKPIMFYLEDHHLVIKTHHTLGNGHFFGQMMGYLLLAIADPATFEKLPPLPMNFGMPVRDLIFQTPRQGLRILAGAIKSFIEYYKDSRPTPSTQDTRPEFPPIVSGSTMGVVCKQVPSDVMKRLNNMKIALSQNADITLNTLLQVLMAFRLAELGLTGTTPIYSIPVDLHRYLKNPRDYHPGNLNGQIRIKSSGITGRDLLAECTELQQKSDEQLESYEPMLMFPGESVLAINTRAYKMVNRRWLLSPIKTGQRFFIFSNLGRLDIVVRPLRKLVDASQGIFTATPLMGDIPLVFNFNMTSGCGNLTAIYDPRVLSQEQVQAIIGLFDMEWITAQFPMDDQSVPAQTETSEA